MSQLLLRRKTTHHAQRLINDGKLDVTPQMTKHDVHEGSPQSDPIFDCHEDDVVQDLC